MTIEELKGYLADTGGECKVGPYRITAADGRYYVNRFDNFQIVERLVIATLPELYNLLKQYETS